MKSSQLELGERLKKLRQYWGYNQSKMAKILDIATSTYQYYERSERSVPSEILIDLSTSKGVNPEWLISGTGDMFKMDSNKTNDISYNNLLLDIVEIVDMALGSKIKPSDKRKLVEYVYGAWIDYKVSSQQDDIVNIKDFVKHNIPLALKLIRTA